MDAFVSKPWRQDRIVCELLDFGAELKVDFICNTIGIPSIVPHFATNERVFSESRNEATPHFDSGMVCPCVGVSVLARQCLEDLIALDALLAEAAIIQRTC